MKPTYKNVKIQMPHCPKCGEKLQGNGSRVMPYICKCGVWEYDWTTEEYEIKHTTKKDIGQTIKGLTFN